jgi:hypothetical protein
MKILKYILPQNPAGDYIFSLLRFIYTHRRLPGAGALYNDFLYRMKVSGELSEPLRVFISDKEHMKIFVRGTVGARHVVPTVGIIDDADELESFPFPDECVIKPTHASGRFIIRRGGAAVDFAMLRKWLRVNFYRSMREANYRSLRPKIIVEELLFGDSNITDYKFFCHGGKARVLQVDTDRENGHKRLFYSPEWNRLNLTLQYPAIEKALQRPPNLDEMLTVAERIASHFSFVRVDLYSDGRQVMVGEVTNLPGAGDTRFSSIEDEKLFSSLLFSPARETAAAIAVEYPAHAAQV